MITLLHIHTLNIGFFIRGNEEWTLPYNLIISEQISALVLTFKVVACGLITQPHWRLESHNGIFA